MRKVTISVTALAVGGLMAPTQVSATPETGNPGAHPHSAAPRAAPINGVIVAPPGGVINGVVVAPPGSGFHGVVVNPGGGVHGVVVGPGGGFHGVAVNPGGGFHGVVVHPPRPQPPGVRLPPPGFYVGS